MKRGEHRDLLLELRDKDVVVDGEAPDEEAKQSKVRQPFSWQKDWKEYARVNSLLPGYKELAREAYSAGWLSGHLRNQMEQHEADAALAKQLDEAIMHLHCFRGVYGDNKYTGPCWKVAEKCRCDCDACEAYRKTVRVRLALETGGEGK